MDYSNVNEVLKYTQDIRYKLIEKISSQIKDESSPEDIELVLKALDSFDKATFTKQKLVIEENNSQIQKQASKVLAEVLSKFNLPKLESLPNGKDYSIDKELSDTDLVPDETKIGPIDLDLNHL